MSSTSCACLSCLASQYGLVCASPVCVYVSRVPSNSTLHVCVSLYSLVVHHFVLSLSLSLSLPPLISSSTVASTHITATIMSLITYISRKAYKQAHIHLGTLSDDAIVSSLSEVAGPAQWTCLHFVCADPLAPIELLSSLLAHNADVSARASSGSTPLHLAAWGGHVRAVEMLLTYHADIHAETRNGRNATHFAARMGHRDVLRVLVKAGADMDKMDVDGKTARMVGEESGTQLEDWKDKVGERVGRVKEWGEEVMKGIRGEMDVEEVEHVVKQWVAKEVHGERRERWTKVVEEGVRRFGLTGRLLDTMDKETIADMVVGDKEGGKEGGLWWRVVAFVEDWQGRGVRKEVMAVVGAGVLVGLWGIVARK